MKKTQTIVDREPLSSDYIESKQDFSAVLSQVKLLPTANWKSPWFYGPIGIAVLSVTISIVSLNPSNAIASSENKKEELNQSKTTLNNVVSDEKLISKDEVKAIVKEEVKENPDFSKTIHHANIANESSVRHQETVVEETHEIIQKEIAVEKVIPVNNQFPHIDGYFTGKIPVESLFDEKGILLNESVQIVSFDLNFFTGRSNVVNSIRGNKVPSEMRSMINNFNIGKTIYITNIKAFDRNGKSYTLPSINFTPM